MYKIKLSKEFWTEFEEKDINKAFQELLPMEFTLSLYEIDKKYHLRIRNKNGDLIQSFRYNKKLICECVDYSRIGVY